LNLIKQYRAYFAKLNALKISVAIFLSIIFTLLLGFHETNDYAWLAPLSVIISLIGMPVEMRRLNVILQRSAGMLLGTLLALLGAIIFKAMPYYVIAYAILLTLIFNYYIGKHHKYSYFLTLSFIYLDILTCFIYATPQHFYLAILHFPFMIFIALIALLLSELITPRNAIKKKIPNMLLQSFNHVREHLGDLANHQINIQWFFYLEKILINAKSQLKEKQFNFFYNNCHRLRMISVKLNYIASHLSISEDATHIFLPELRNITRLIDTMLDNLSKAQPIKPEYLKEALDLLTQRFNQSDYANNQNFKVALHELYFILNDLKAINHTPENLTLPAFNHPKGLTWGAYGFAIRITLSVFAANFVINYFNVLSGYQTFIAATVIAALPHNGTLLYKFSLRAIGLLIAGLSGLTFGILLMPIDSILLTTLTIIVFSYLITWWTFKYDHESYAGIQCGFVFVLLLLSQGQTHYGITMNVNKFEIIMIASFIALLINLLIAPSLPSHNIKKRIKKTILDIQAYLQALVENNNLDYEVMTQKLKTINAEINFIHKTTILLYFSPKKRRETMISANRLLIILSQLKKLHQDVINNDKKALSQALITSIKTLLLSEAHNTNNGLNKADIDDAYICLSIITQEFRQLQKIYEV